MISQFQVIQALRKQATQRQNHAASYRKNLTNLMHKDTGGSSFKSELFSSGSSSSSNSADFERRYPSRSPAKKGTQVGRSQAALSPNARGALNPSTFMKVQNNNNNAEKESHKSSDSNTKRSYGKQQTKLSARSALQQRPPGQKDFNASPKNHKRTPGMEEQIQNSSLLGANLMSQSIHIGKFQDRDSQEYRQKSGSPSRKPRKSITLNLLLNSELSTPMNRGEVKFDEDLDGGFKHLQEFLQQTPDSLKAIPSGSPVQHKFNFKSPEKEMNGKQDPNIVVPSPFLSRENSRSSKNEMRTTAAAALAISKFSQKFAKLKNLEGISGSIQSKNALLQKKQTILKNNQTFNEIEEVSEHQSPPITIINDLEDIKLELDKSKRASGVSCQKQTSIRESRNGGIKNAAGSGKHLPNFSLNNSSVDKDITMMRGSESPQYRDNANTTQKLLDPISIGSDVDKSPSIQNSPNKASKVDRKNNNSIQVSKLTISIDEMNPKDMIAAGTKDEQSNMSKTSFLAVPKEESEADESSSHDNSKHFGPNDIKKQATVLFKIGDKEFTQADIIYLNKVYEDGKKKKKLDQHQETSSESPKPPSKCKKFRKKHCHFLKRFKYFKEEFEEEEEEDDDDWSVIETPRYSSGESDNELGWQYQELQEEEQKKRMLELWHKVAIKAIGGGKIVRRFSELSDGIVMFGASRRIAVEIEEEIVPLPFILLPENKIRMGWNMVTLLLLLYTASFVPYRTSYIDQAPSGLEAWEWIVDSLFCIDILVNFISAYENSDKNIEVRLKMIAKTYVTSWFLFDMAAIFPFQLLEGQQEADLIAASNAILDDPTTNTTIGNIPGQAGQAGQNTKGSSQNINKLIRLARLPRLYRLLRILRLFKILSLLNNNASFKRLQEVINMNAGIQRMLLIAVSVVFMVHLMACLYFLVGKFEDEDSYNWIVYNKIQDEIDSYQYLVSVYWALQTLTTVGYGDIMPRSVYEKIAALIWMIIGVGFYSFTIGNLASIFNSIDIKSSHLQQQLQVLAEFSKRTRLPDEVQNRVKRFLENNHGDYLSLFDQKQLLAEVPASLRAEVVSHTHAEIIDRIRFFSDKDPPFLFTILPLLKPMKVYAKDTLYCQGDYAEEVFFIYHGRIKMHYDMSHQFLDDHILIPFNLYVEGSYFGDSDLFSDDGRNIRDCTAIAVIESQLLVITRKELFSIFGRFKDIKEEMKQVGRERMKHHKDMIEHAVENFNKHQNVDEDSSVLTEQEESESDDAPLEPPKKANFIDNLKQSIAKIIPKKNHNPSEFTRQRRKTEILAGDRPSNQKLRQKTKQIKGNKQDEVYNILKNFNGKAHSATPKSLANDYNRNFFSNGDSSVTPSRKMSPRTQRLLQNRKGSESFSNMRNQFNYPMSPQQSPSGPNRFSFVGADGNLRGSILSQKKDSNKALPDFRSESERYRPLTDFKPQSPEKKRDSAPQIKQQQQEHFDKKVLISSLENLKKAMNQELPQKQLQQQDHNDVTFLPDVPNAHNALQQSFKEDEELFESNSSNDSVTIEDIQKEQQESNAFKNLLQMTRLDQNVMQSIIQEEIAEEDIESEFDRHEKLKQLKNDIAIVNSSSVSHSKTDTMSPLSHYQHWDDQTDEIFASFQENMALIAGNSFEILKLYGLIKSDFIKLSQQVQKVEGNIAGIKNKTEALESKLTNILKLTQ